MMQDGYRDYANDMYVPNRSGEVTFIGDEKLLQAQQDRQKELALDDQRLKPIEAARKTLNLTTQEEMLVGKLTTHSLMFMLLAILSGPNDADAKKKTDEMTIRYERELIELHRSIVAKAVAASRLPASGNL